MHPSERIIRYAFEYAKANKRKKVTCFTKDNILKLTDGLFHKIFEEIGAEYPEIEREHWIVDIGAAKLADTPEAFDVIVLPNLYGDILSDVAAQITGSVGLAGSANIGRHAAMFEAIHGSAPRRAGQDAANPSGLILASVIMLIHIGQPKAAAVIHNAWLKTIEEGIHTYDIYKKQTSKKMAGTKAFAKAVIERLGQTPQTLPSVQYSSSANTFNTQETDQKTASPTKSLAGVDVFINWGGSVDQLAEKLKQVHPEKLMLSMIANRGVKVWPEKQPETICVDCWRCRFTAKEKNGISHMDIVQLLMKLSEKNIDFVQTENLTTFDGKPGYSLGQEEQ